MLLISQSTNISDHHSEFDIKISGAYSCGEIPVPIPNTAVKSVALRILGWRRPGKVGTARFN